MTVTSIPVGQDVSNTMSALAVRSLLISGPAEMAELKRQHGN